MIREKITNVGRHLRIFRRASFDCLQLTVIEFYLDKRVKHGCMIDMN